jgi:protein FRA10AC1
MASFNSAHLAALDAAARQRQHSELMSMNAYDRHKKLVHNLTRYYGGTLPSSDTLEIHNSQPRSGATTTAGITALQNNTKLKIVQTDEDVLRESYRFIRTPEDDTDVDSWAVRLAQKYYSRLFREYCIADLSRFEEGKLGLRWRTEKEVVSGKGQFTCGTRGCEEKRGLASFEVPFGYVEVDEKKQALVKVRLCPEHAYQLNYKKNREAEKRQDGIDSKKSKKKKRKKKRKKEVDTSSSSSSSESESSSEEDEKVVELPHRKKARQSGDEELFTGLFE